ncbi:helix-turn-helix transcriptional regulator [Cytobacillus oceanisediminis]|uniref:helix-turn-helix domain-containing protein n=1 Tax=Cytobacillus oceanisediminis TaxID=665099 RepID=UPI0023DAD7A2|nr:helix-turn-helix transcriptional regulator [Cytobacillus oceanisediminis]MDF2039862.1 helix-turn-helix transcriptional regulator [Cytobacillus oceanisediminis]
MNNELLKHCRQLANLTQKELANRMGVHDSLISKLENGSAEVTTRTQDKLLQVFNDSGVTPNDIALLGQVFQNRKMKAVKKDWSAVK